MNILSIETATLQGSVALRRGSGAVSELKFERGMVHGRDLAPAIERLLHERSMAPRDIDLIGCDIGPGSYTGLRVGLAYARTMGWALSKPLVGIVSLDALARQYARAHPNLPDGTRVTPALDAKWNQVYYATYSIRNAVPTRIAEPQAEPPERALRDGTPRIVFGDALEALMKPSSLPPGSCADPDRSFWHPLASTVLELAALKFAEFGADNLIGLEPLYLRATEAELKRPKP